MGRRADARGLSDRRAHQKRLDDALEEVLHGPEENGPRPGRRQRGRAEPPPFDQRVEFWLLEREGALASGILEGPTRAPLPSPRAGRPTSDPSPSQESSGSSAP